MVVDMDFTISGFSLLFTNAKAWELLAYMSISLYVQLGNSLELVPVSA